MTKFFWTDCYFRMKRVSIHDNVIMKIPNVKVYKANMKFVVIIKSGGALPLFSHKVGGSPLKLYSFIFSD